jgi:hypothetical protein
MDQTNAKANTQIQAYTEDEMAFMLETLMQWLGFVNLEEWR